MNRVFIVVFDDEMGLCVPYGLDPNCEGALSLTEPVAVFPDRKAARRAIAISKNLAELVTAQGGPANTDFTYSIKSVKICTAELISGVTKEQGK